MISVRAQILELGGISSYFFQLSAINTPIVGYINFMFNHFIHLCMNNLIPLIFLQILIYPNLKFYCYFIIMIFLNIYVAYLIFLILSQIFFFNIAPRGHYVFWQVTFFYLSHYILSHVSYHYKPQIKDRDYSLL